MKLINRHNLVFLSHWCYGKSCFRQKKLHHAFGQKLMQSTDNILRKVVVNYYKYRFAFLQYTIRLHVSIYSLARRAQMYKTLLFWGRKWDLPGTALWSQGLRWFGTIPQSRSFLKLASRYIPFTSIGIYPQSSGWDIGVHLCPYTTPIFWYFILRYSWG